MAESTFHDCAGVTFSPQHAEAFQYCALEPIPIAAPGE